MKINLTPISAEFLPHFDHVPRGYRFGVCNAKIRGEHWTKPDVAVVVSDMQATVGAVYTQNAVKAAPVNYCLQSVDNESVHALIINSGNANACTGDAGDATVTEMVGAAATVAGCQPTAVIPMQTGVIGVPITSGQISSACQDLQLGSATEDLAACAQAICTTDRFAKSLSKVVTIDDTDVTLTIVGKGAGMINPALATMLIWIGTDAAVAQPVLQSTLVTACAGSLNKMSVDNDMSTNDSVVLMANGAAGVVIEEHTPAYAEFAAAVQELLTYMCRAIVRDGEGSNHCVEIVIDGASSHERASEIARYVSASQLVKTAIFGRDPNWGRVAASVGAAEPALDPNRMTVSFAGVPVFSKGMPLTIDRDAVVERLADENVEVKVDLGMGTGSAVFWTSDLGYEYVRINAEYTT